MHRLWVAQIILLFALFFSISCLTDPNAPEQLKVEITSVEFSGDYIWQESGQDSGRSNEAVALAAPIDGVRGLLCRFTIRWTRFTDSDFASYKLYRSASPGIPENTGDRILLKTLYVDSVTSYDDTYQLDWDSTYYYRIQVEDVFGKSWWSNEVTITAPVPELTGSSVMPLPAPELSITANGWVGFDLTWTACHQEWFEGYSLFRSNSSNISENPEDAELVFQTGSMTDTVFTDLGLTPDLHYFYALRLDAKLGQHVWSNEVTGETHIPYPDQISLSFGFDESANYFEDRIVMDGDGNYIYFVVDHYLYVSPRTELVKLTSSFSWAGSATLDYPGIAGPFDIHPDGTKAFAAENYRNPSKVLVFETSGMTLEDEIEIGNNIQWIHVLSTGQYVYFLQSGRIDVYTTGDYSLVTRIYSSQIVEGSRLCSSSDGTRLFCSSPGAILIFDTSTHEIVSTIPVAYNFLDIRFSGDGSRLYGVGYSGDLMAIDLQSETVLWTSNPGSPIGGMCLLSPDDDYIYLTHTGWYNPLVFIVEASTGDLVDQVYMESGHRRGYGIESSPDGMHVYLISKNTSGRPGIHMLSR